MFVELSRSEKSPFYMQYGGGPLAYMAHSLADYINYSDRIKYKYCHTVKQRTLKNSSKRRRFTINSK